MPHFPPSNSTAAGFGRSKVVPFGGTGSAPAFPPTVAAPFSSIGLVDREANYRRGHRGGRSFDTGCGGGRGGRFGKGRGFDGGHSGGRGFDRGRGGREGRGFDGRRRGGRGGGGGFAKPRDDLDNIVLPNQDFQGILPFEKNFYVESPVVEDMTELEVMDYRRKRDITIEGRDVPRKVLSFQEANFPGGVQPFVTESFNTMVMNVIKTVVIHTADPSHLILANVVGTSRPLPLETLQHVSNVPLAAESLYLFLSVNTARREGKALIFDFHHFTAGGVPITIKSDFEDVDMIHDPLESTFFMNTRSILILTQAIFRSYCPPV